MVKILKVPVVLQVQFVSTFFVGKLQEKLEVFKKINTRPGRFKDTPGREIDSFFPGIYPGGVTTFCSCQR